MLHDCSGSSACQGKFDATRLRTRAVRTLQDIPTLMILMHHSTEIWENQLFVPANVYILLILLPRHAQLVRSDGFLAPMSENLKVKVLGVQKGLQSVAQLMAPPV